jgi:hypothetical protein
MSIRLAIIYALPLLLAGAAAVAAANTLPNRAIVSGHHVQPRADEFGGTDAPSDLPPQEDKEVGRLLQQFLGRSASAVSPSAPRH